MNGRSTIRTRWRPGSGSGTGRTRQAPTARRRTSRNQLSVRLHRRRLRRATADPPVPGRRAARARRGRAAEERRAAERARAHRTSAQPRAPGRTRTTDRAGADDPGGAARRRSRAAEPAGPTRRAPRIPGTRMTSRTKPSTPRVSAAGGAPRARTRCSEPARFGAAGTANARPGADAPVNAAAAAATRGRTVGAAAGHRRRDRGRPADDAITLYAPVEPIRDAVLSTVDLVKVHGQAARAVTALDGITLDVERGRFTAIMGASGSGKSTLLHCLAGLDKPTRGKVLLGDHRPDPGLRAEAHPAAPGPHRLRVPVLRPAAAAHRPAEHHAPDRGGRSQAGPGPGWTPCWTRWSWAACCVSCPPSSPAASSSGSRWPGPCCRAPTWCSPTSRPARWTPAPPARWSASCAASVDHLGQTVVMVTHDPLAAQHTDRAVILHEGRLIGEVAQPDRARRARRAGRAGRRRPLPAVDARVGRAAHRRRSDRRSRLPLAAALPPARGPTT